MRGSVVKRLLLVIPVVLALILVSLFMPVRRVSIEGIGTLSFKTAVTLSIGTEAAYASPASLDVKKGTFTRQASTGNQPVTGVGFQPKAVIFFWTNQTAEGFSAGLSYGVGFAASATQEFALSMAADDNVATTNDGSRRSNSNSIIILSNGTPTLGAQADVASFDADGFTVNWTTNNGAATIIHYIALGGSDITNTYAGTFNSTIVTGNQIVSGVGFQPSFVMFLAPERAMTLDTNYAGGAFGIGFMTSAQQGAMAFGIRDNQATATTADWQRTDHCIVALRRAAAEASATFVSMDADGFTINWDNAYGGATAISFLAIKGGWHFVGNFTQPGSTGQQPVTGTGFQPNGLMMFSFNDVANIAVVTVTPAAKISIGAAQSSTARGTIWGHHADGITPTDTNSLTKTTCAISLATGPTTLNAEADFVSFDSNGFTLNWTSADATARQIIYWAMGSVVPSISNAPTSWSLGIVQPSTSYWSGLVPTFPLDDTECNFTVTNNGTVTVNITVKGTNFTGGSPGWTLVTSSPIADEVRIKAGKSGDLLETNMVILTTSEQSFITGLTATGTKKWEIKMETGSSFSNGDPKTGIITLTATAA